MVGKELSSGGTDVFFPYGKIPINQSDCPTTTCEALELITLSKTVESNVTCNFVMDLINCLVDVFGTGVLFPVQATVLPCNQPPAIHFELREPGGPLIQERTTAHNTGFRLFNFKVDVILCQLQNALGLGVCIK